MKGVWITWEHQRRNIGISSALGWDFYEINYDRIERVTLIRYLLSILDTVRVLIKKKPEIVIAQNPSIILAVLIVLLKRVFSYKAVIDAHNSGLFPFEERFAFFMYISRMLQKFADLTLVTNEALKKYVVSNRGKAFVLPDMVPDIQVTGSYTLSGEINIVFICTYAEDEPYLEVIKAARLLPENIFLYFTGKYEGKVNVESKSANVRLLGFVPEEEYWPLLASADIIMDLTLREDCLVCGAYEGVALEKPLILSNTAALKNYFKKGCIYVDPNAPSIAEGIVEAIENREVLISDIKHLRVLMKREWDNSLHRLQDILTNDLKL